MAPGFGAGAGPAFRREKAETGVNADVAKLSRKVRLVCHAFMKEAWINRPFAAKPKAAGKPAAFFMFIRGKAGRPFGRPACWQALTKKIFLSDAYSSGVEIKNHEHQIEVMISDKDILVNGWPY